MILSQLSFLHAQIKVSRTLYMKYRPLSDFFLIAQILLSSETLFHSYGSLAGLNYGVFRLFYLLQKHLFSLQ